MKATAFLTLLALMTPLAAQTTPPAAPGEGKPAARELLPSQQAFLNLPEERRKKFVGHLSEANRIFQQKRVFETLEELRKAQEIFKDSPDLYNLRGSCYVELRDFDKALANFTKALEFAKDSPNIEFNIGEVYFVTKQWEKSLAIFERILKPVAKENLPLARLVEFKILLCKNKLGQKDEVKQLANKYDELDDSPYYYYAQAALAYEDDNIVKAEQLLATAARVFRDPRITAPWKDTIVEYGYIKGFHGEEAADIPSEEK